MSQFPNERALFSFVGLTPREFSSGDKRRLGHISRQGSGRIRGLLVEAAWFAVRFDTGLRQDFFRITHRAGKKRAIVAIARKLIGKVRASFRTQLPYQVAFKGAA
jgi:transposase